ncbi:DNA repair protein RAD51 homolog 4 isoform X4 [Moschus berezovskii]|uniref:DNA repair protein RAD51 homolog 4 isoform X4 n=1 Tax=Moschus berezovskii TaxID=68408 RepID=UPI0024452041|nr:DNA repair protein RAD51 homolog 4 isoform X4 [Moschus berezovskii]
MGVLRAGLCPGLTQDMVQLLQSRGIKTVVDLVSADLEEVAQKCGLSYKALVALRRVLLAQFSAFPFNGADLYEELKTSTAILSTGIGSLDKLLDAGLYTGEVTEIIGAPGSGKTQVCLCVAANVAHGLQQNVLYIDSNGGLTASRILQLLQARTLDEEEQGRPTGHCHSFPRSSDLALQLSIQRVENRPVRQSPSPSVPESLCRGRSSPEDPGGACVWHLPDAGRAAGPARRCVPTGLALMMQLARELKTLARDLSVAVLVTNHMTRDRDSGQLKPALGRSWSFVPSTRILLDSTQGSGSLGSRRVACLTKSPRLPTGCQETVDLGSWGTPASQGDHKGQWKQSPVFQGNHT